jgi:outer membrane protein insertion porin family
MKLQSTRFFSRLLPLMPQFPAIHRTAIHRTAIAAAVLALCAKPALAVEPFTVKDIRVEGIQRTEAGTVFSYLPVRVGEVFNNEKAVASIKALYATGFFKDVRIEVEDNVLVILIDERPSIAKVEFTGTKEFEKEALTKALKDVGIGESRVFDQASIDRAEQELKRQYLSRGLYGVQIKSVLTPIERNRVNVSFEVQEGEIARIQQISIVGNKAFSDKELRDLIALSTPGLFTFYSKSDQYSKQKLTGDLETIRSFYLNRGYIEMQVESTQVAITPDKKDIHLTINIVEGEKYTVSDVKFEGETFGREEELRKLLLIRKGQIFSGDRLTETNKRISERMGNFGYAFANVNANPEIDRDKKEVAFTIFIDPGKRVYVRRINVSGNTRTRDEVVRREFRQLEGSWYDGNNIRLSRDRVDRLGFFKEVTIDTPEVAGTADQVDVNLTVVEKPTGNFLIGAGFSQSEKLTLTAQIQQANFAGSGNTVGFDINTSRQNRTIAISQSNPYFTDDGVSLSYDLFLRNQRELNNNIGSFRLETKGGKVSFGVPFSEFDTVFFGAGVEVTKVDANADSPIRFVRFVTDFGNGQSASTSSVPLTVAYQRDSRDSASSPSIGRFQRANLELDFLGDLKYYRAVYQQQFFRPLPGRLTLALNGEIGYGHGLSGRPYPVFKNFVAGGIGTVRGYETNSLGALDPARGDALGGAARIFGNIELQFPLPGTGADRTVRAFAFLDGGNVFQEGQKITGKEFRYAAGLGISYFSPVGPLKLSFGRALNARIDDRKQSFQFQIGSGF